MSSTLIAFTKAKSWGWHLHGCVLAHEIPVKEIQDRNDDEGGYLVVKQNKSQ